MFFRQSLRLERKAINEVGPQYLAVYDEQRSLSASAVSQAMLSMFWAEEDYPAKPSMGIMVCGGAQRRAHR